MRRVFNGSPRLRVNNTKSFIGHAMGAAGALELLGNVPAFHDGMAHATINLDRLDPACGLPQIVANRPRDAGLGVVTQRRIQSGGCRRIGPGRSVDLIARLYQPVTDTQFGHQNLRRVGVWFDFLTQLAHEDAQIMRVMHVDRAPHFLKEMLVGDHVSGVLGQNLQ